MRRVTTYGEKVRQFREEKSWTQEELTERAGLQSVRTVQRVEKNETQSPETLRAIAAAFNVDVDALRTERAVPESRLIGTWLVSNNREFPEVEEAHQWQMSYRSVLAPLEDEGREKVDHLLDDAQRIVGRSSHMGDPIFYSYRFEDRRRYSTPAR